MGGERRPGLEHPQPRSPPHETQSQGRGPGAGGHLGSPSSRIPNLLIS